VNKVTKFANKAAFFFFLRLPRAEIVDKFIKWVDDYGLENLKSLIQRGEFPTVAPDLFAKSNDYLEYLQDISVDYLVEIIVEASPEIAEYLVYMGPAGGVYLAKLRLHFLKLAQHPEEAPIPSIVASPDTEVVRVTCDKCHKSFPVKRNEFNENAKCPFCGE
jgi:uncharacterized protein (DUF1919 family)